MNTAILAKLDQAELLQLALNASTGGNAGDAIGYLKEAVSRPEATAPAHYLLGAEYAQIKMYERAIGEMEAALALDPALTIARLQLGMLWLGVGDAARAAEVLRALGELDEADPLFQFGAGLRHLQADQRAEAIACLNKGIALNPSNAPLNVDMRKIVLEIEGQIAADAAQVRGGGQHILLSAYTGNENN